MSPTCDVKGAPFGDAVAPLRAPRLVDTFADVYCTCPVCGKALTLKPTKMFLGFSNVDCPACFHREMGPLRQPDRGVYWIVAGWFILRIVTDLLRVLSPSSRGRPAEIDFGTWLLAAFFGTLSGVVLWHDKRLRVAAAMAKDQRAVADKEARHREIDSRKFSWVRALLYWIVLTVVIAGVFFLATEAGWAPNSSGFDERVGMFCGQLLVPVLAVSYFAQTRSRRGA